MPAKPQSPHRHHRWRRRRPWRPPTWWPSRRMLPRRLTAQRQAHNRSGKQGQKRRAQKPARKLALVWKACRGITALQTTVRARTPGTRRAIRKAGSSPTTQMCAPRQPRSEPCLCARRSRGRAWQARATWVALLGAIPVAAFRRGDCLGLCCVRRHPVTPSTPMLQPGLWLPDVARAPCALRAAQLVLLSYMLRRLSQPSGSLLTRPMPCLPAMPSLQELEGTTRCTACKGSRVQGRR